MASANLLQHETIVVEQPRKFFQLRDQYGLYSPDGDRIGAIEQVEQGSVQRLAGFVSGLDAALPSTLAVTDADGRAVLRLRKPWFRSVVEVRGPDGDVVGTVVKQIRLGKARFVLTGPDGAELGEVRAQDWRARDFTIVDASGTEIARVAQQWRGLVIEGLTDADTYVVDLQDAPEPHRSLALAAAVSIDLVMKEGDNGGVAT